jgi:hypothetical protein
MAPCIATDFEGGPSHVVRPGRGSPLPVTDEASGPSAGRWSGLCVATVVFGDYREYIPYYIHSISVAYPTYAVKIFVTDPELPESVLAALACLRRLGLSRFEVRVGCFRLFANSHTPVVGRQALGIYLRWLLPPAEFAGFEYGYVGDVDFLILPEAESLHEGHLRHIRKLGVPYSNVVRRGTRRLSGLHFFEVRPYFAASWACTTRSSSTTSSSERSASAPWQRPRGSDPSTGSTSGASGAGTKPTSTGGSRARTGGRGWPRISTARGSRRFTAWSATVTSTRCFGS